MKYEAKLLKNNKRGALIEYSLLVALIAIVVTAAIILQSDQLVRLFTAVASVLEGV